MKKLLFIIVLIATMALAYYGVSTYSGKIQTDIKARLASALIQEGVSNNIVADVSGRDVTLAGTVMNEEGKAEAEKIASDLYGVRVVNNNINVAEAPPPMAVEFMEPELTQAMDEAPSFDFDVLLSGPEVGLEVDVVEASPQEPVLVAEPAPIDVVETTPTRIVAELDRPLSVKNGRIIRRSVDSIIAAKTVEAECERDLTYLLDGHKINYESASAKIHKNSYNLLDRLIVAAKNCHKDTIITINGYTDNEGNVEYNRQLSLQRARSVGKYMLKRGVAKQVKVVGHGENDPIADNDTEEGRAQNRRIEFRVFKAKN